MKNSMRHSDFLYEILTLKDEENNPIVEQEKVKTVRVRRVIKDNGWSILHDLYVQRRLNR